MPWRPLDGLVTSLPPESEARVERGDLPDGEVEWQLESEWLGAPVIQRWTIGPGGELRSWTLDRDARPVDPDGDFNDNVTHAWVQFTIADGDPIEPPDVDAVPDAGAVGAPPDLPLAPPAASPDDIEQVAACEHPSAIYRVTLPEGWWTNAAFNHPELGELSACQFFAPEPFDVAAATREEFVPEGVALTINLYDNACLGYITPILSARTTAVDGHPAEVVELAQGKEASNPPGQYQYEVNLAPGVECETGGRFIVGRTAVTMAGDYEANKAALDEMMQSMEIIEP